MRGRKMAKRMAKRKLAGKQHGTENDTGAASPSLRHRSPGREVRGVLSVQARSGGLMRIKRMRAEAIPAAQPKFTKNKLLIQIKNHKIHFKTTS